MARVHISEVIHADGIALITGAGHDVTCGWQGGALDEDVGAILIRTDPLSAAQMDHASGLQVISKHGVGCDNIDIATARARGIPVTITPGANAGAVAEHTIGLIFATARRFGPLDRAVRVGEWPRGGAGISDVAGRRLLIVGFGAVGQRVAKMAAALGLHVVIHAPGRNIIGDYKMARTLEEGLRGADILSLHLPLTAQTSGMIGVAELRLLSPGAIVINTARGGIVDEPAAAMLCAEGHLGGIGFDVFDGEPIHPDSPLLTIENAVLTPHAAAMSDDAKRAMAIMAAQNVLDGLAGRIDPAMLFAG
ncbi:MAG: NAD(P)-dependent oxidoreductase [Pseudomonadota bacterium]